MANRGQLRTTIRAELQEATPGFWQDFELNTWIDEAHADLVAPTRQETTSTLTLVSGTESYALPADFYLVRRVEIQTAVGSSYWTEVQLLDINFRRPADPVNAAQNIGVPSGCYIYGGRIVFVPAPDLAYSGTLYYYKNATAFSADSDMPSYPEGIPAPRFDRLIVLYVCSMALRKRQDSAYTTYGQDYNSSRAAIIAEALERGSAGPLVVHDDWDAQ